MGETFRAWRGRSLTVVASKDANGLVMPCERICISLFVAVALLIGACTGAHANQTITAVETGAACPTVVITLPVGPPCVIMRWFGLRTPRDALVHALNAHEQQRHVRMDGIRYLYR